MDYRDALAYLYSFTDTERVPGMVTAAGLNLDKVHRFFDLAGRPETAFQSILIAGSKGKGSTANYLAGALQAAGYRAGLYTQPHLTSFRERIQVDGALLPESRLGALVDAIRPVVARMQVEAPEYGAPTTYEIATALALRQFADEQVDYAVLEIGLGGRLDAVNAVRAPLVSVITSLSLDHTQVLGSTIDKIAFEKAGIIRPGTPVVSAPQPAAALAVLAATAAARQAPLYIVGTDIVVAPAPGAAPAECTAHQYGRPRRLTQDVEVRFGPRLRERAGGVWPELDRPLALTLPLLGGYQALNAAAACAAGLLLAAGGATRLTPAAMRAGFAAVDWPGRLEIAEQRPLLVLDGAHNGDSATQLAAAFPQNFCYRKLVLVLGVSGDKDSGAILRPLLPLAGHVIVTQSGHPRAAPPAAVAAVAARILAEPDSPAGGPAVQMVEDVGDAITAARGLVGPDDAILVSGSLFVVGDARAALGIAPAVDPLSGDFFYRLDKTPP